MPYDQRKHDPNRGKCKTIAIDRRNDQSTFYAPVAPHIVFSGRLHSGKVMKIDWKDQKCISKNSSENALPFNVGRELKKK